MVRATKAKTENDVNIAYAAQLWQMADALRGRMGVAELKQIEIRPLGAMRDALSQKLISGELRVRDVLKITGRAA